MVDLPTIQEAQTKIDVAIEHWRERAFRGDQAAVWIERALIDLRRDLFGA